MSAIQIGFILFTFLAPPLLWLLSRKVQSERLVKGICYTLAGCLVVAYIGSMTMVGLGWPMHLCDWAAVATLFALLRRSPMAFELAYCWGIAGTAQALFTPALVVRDDLRAVFFFTVHSVIPASVLWLIFECKMRPRMGAYFRVMVWSEVYLGCALVVNALTDLNYGFLSERPETASLLDYFSNTWWVYVLQINLTAAVLFGILLLPWRTWRRGRGVGLTEVAAKASQSCDSSES